MCWRCRSTKWEEEPATSDVDSKALRGLKLPTVTAEAGAGLALQDGSGVLRLPGGECCHLSHFQASWGQPRQVLLRCFPLLDCDGKNQDGLKEAEEVNGSSWRRMASHSRKRWVRQEPFGTYACCGGVPGSAPDLVGKKQPLPNEVLQYINNIDKHKNSLFFFSLFSLVHMV